MEKVNFLNRWIQPPVETVEFILDENNKFIAYFPEPVNELIFPSGGTIKWHSEGKEPIILVNACQGSFFDAFCDLYRALRDIFKGKRVFPFDNHSKNLGYEWNLICADDPYAHNELEKDILRHQIWGVYTGPETWLYPLDGKIILEITPFYAWTKETIESEEDDTLEAFRERMRDYTSIVRFELSPEVAMRWHDQAKELVLIMYKNFEQTKGGYYVDIETQI